MARAATTVDKIAAQAAKPKIVRLKGRYTEIELKGTGKLPEWDDQDKLTTEQFNARWRAARYFYYYHHDIKELRPFVVTVYGKDWTKLQHKSFSKLKDWQVSSTLACICKVHLDGANWQPETKAWADKKIAEILEEGAKIVDPDDKPTEEVKKAPNIQDRLRDIKEDTMAELEEMEDGLIRDGVVPATNILTWLRGKNTPQQIIGDIERFYAEKLAFYLEAREGKDAQLKEGFAHYKKKDWDNWIKWLEGIVDSLNTYKRGKVAARTVRIRKPPAPEKVVSKLKFLREFADLGLTSIRPVEIIGATQLWVYNVKTRKLGVYNASTMEQQLTVKGSTIIGWEPKTSVAKTLRKPAEQLKALAACGKVQLRTFLGNIKATEINLNGRINDQVILLKATK
jgi:hypothetical protein